MEAIAAPRARCRAELHFGEDAPTEVVLGVDFNGVHALSDYLLFGPALVAALRRAGPSSPRFSWASIASQLVEALPGL